METINFEYHFPKTRGHYQLEAQYKNLLDNIQALLDKAQSFMDFDARVSMMYGKNWKKEMVNYIIETDFELNDDWCRRQVIKYAPDLYESLHFNMIDSNESDEELTRKMIKRILDSDPKLINGWNRFRVEVYAPDFFRNIRICI